MSFKILHNAIRLYNLFTAEMKNQEHAIFLIFFFNKNAVVQVGCAAPL